MTVLRGRETVCSTELIMNPIPNNLYDDGIFLVAARDDLEEQIGITRVIG
jgi:hypothetical protein